jgi:hypothetical protein
MAIFSQLPEAPEALKRPLSEGNFVRHRSCSDVVGMMGFRAHAGNLGLLGFCNLRTSQGSGFW